MNIVVAINNKNGIGYNNVIPWKCKEDLLFLRDLIKNNIIIMGRKTLDSIGHPLLHCDNIILSSQKRLSYKNIELTDNINDAIYLARKIKSISDKKIFILGGSQIYEEFLLHCDGAYITRIDDDSECDTFFPYDKLLKTYKLEWETILSPIAILQYYKNNNTI